MPNYVIINGTTVIDANTDLFGRNTTLGGLLKVGNTSIDQVSITSNTGVFKQFTSNTATIASSLTVGNSTVAVTVTPTGIASLGALTVGNTVINGTATISGQLSSGNHILNQPSGTEIDLSFQQGGITRFYQYLSADGSTLGIASANNTGGYNATPIAINRTSGIANFSSRPTFAGLVPFDTGNFNPATKADLTGATFSGDITTYRSGAVGTGAIYLNQAKTAYFSYGGADYNIVGGNLYVSGSTVYANNVPLAGLTNTPVFTNGLQVQSNITLQSGSSLNWYNTLAPVDTRRWDFVVDNTGSLLGRTINDAYTVGANWLAISRSGQTATALTLTASNINLNGAISISNGLAVTGPMTSTGVIGNRSASQGGINLQLGGTTGTGFIEFFPNGSAGRSGYIGFGPPAGGALIIAGEGTNYWNFTGNRPKAFNCNIAYDTSSPTFANTTLTGILNLGANAFLPQDGNLHLGYVNDYLSNRMFDKTISQTVAGVTNFNSTPVFNSTAIDILRGNVLRYRITVDTAGNMLHQNGDSGDNFFYITTGGALWTKQFGDLNTRIEARGAAFAASRLLRASTESWYTASVASLIASAAATGMGTSNGGYGAISARSNDGNAGTAGFMEFLNQGRYGAYFGLDTNNEWRVGGWSMGNVAYPVWHQGRINPVTDIRLAFAGDQDLNTGAGQGFIDLYAGAVVTGMRSDASRYTGLRYRYLQKLDSYNNWYTIGYV